MLPKFSDMSAAETPIGPFLGRRRWNQVGKVGFDVGFDGSSGTLEVAEPLQFVRDELIVRRTLHRQEILEKIHNLGRPRLAPVATTCLGLIVGLVPEIVRAQLIEPGSAHSQTVCRAERIKHPNVEIFEDLQDECGR